MELPISHSFGDFKVEVAEKIESFRAFKRKTFVVRTVSTSSQERKTNFKVCGMNLKPYEARKTFEKVIDRKEAAKIPQVRQIFKKECGKREEQVQYFSWNGETKCQRKVLSKSKYLETVPWGFNSV